MSNQVYDKSDSSNDEDDESPVEVQSEQLIQCQACGRRMRPSVFAKHPNLCRENPAKKRLVNVFDMTRYRAVKAGDKTIPVAQLTSINSHQGSPTHLNNQSNSNIRPSQTRSAKRDRRPDAVVPPIINKFCQSIIFVDHRFRIVFNFCTFQVVRCVNEHFVTKPMIDM